ncbi:hypothetical protein JRO89_XS09G0005900 [Xanthoceras sorbifolium]|uniref:Protein kinase domain-containing protein n=1 Tax=Xanthoceras sorbifolium TaxID=99658 RepID=A0ABQ8HK49_9ROSI|nr:hypothetical protein JRO89_XS09G0005900 [Xanthoceras sorbifolium]
MNARLGDFGLARLYDHGRISHTTNVVGTIGYIAPEMTRTGKPTTSSDGDAYGVLLLEMVTGRRPTDAANWMLVDWGRTIMETDFRPTMRQVMRYLGGDDVLPFIDDWGSADHSQLVSDPDTMFILRFSSYTFKSYLNTGILFQPNVSHHLPYVSEPTPRRQLLGCVRTCSDDCGRPFRLLLLVIHSPSLDLWVGFEDRALGSGLHQTLDLVEVQNGIANSLKKHLSSIKDQKARAENEALELFFEKAELDISKVPTLKETAELVVKQCAGLPLAIVTIASSLKGEEDIREWRNALSELTNKVRSIKVRDDEVFVRLKFSFDRLKDEKIQRCFLYCALYPEDHDIPKTELVDYWIAEGLVEEMDNLQATEDRAHIMIKRLVNNCLLLESINRRERSCMKVHDVVRDMVLRYITSESPLFMVKAGLKLEELPSGQHWKENLDKVSLMNNFISEIPSSMSPKCPILSTLFLQYNPLESIPESFFSQMHGLMILNLSGTEIESLPNSISELTSLTGLLLNNCYRLKQIPSLAKLQALQILDLGFTAMNEVPTGMEMLTNLTNLDLYSTELHNIPAGIFPKLCRLQKLVINWGLDIERVAIDEAARLKNLDSVKVQFRNLQDFNCYVKFFSSHGGPNEYQLFLCPKGVGTDWNVSNISGIPTFNTLERLEYLWVAGLHNLTVLLNLSESTPPDQYSHLKGVHVYFCSEVKKLFCSKLLLELKNLEWIDVYNCPKMEELITIDDDDDNEERSQKEFLLPKLKRLSLRSMPELKNICSSNGVMVCDSLQEIAIHGCPQLKRLPLYLPVDEKGQPSPPPALQKIAVTREWWEALEWDHLHPHAKTLLLPFCDDELHLLGNWRSSPLQKDDTDG